jgi:hypothetical protein
MLPLVENESVIISDNDLIKIKNRVVVVHLFISVNWVGYAKRKLILKQFSLLLDVSETIYGMGAVFIYIGLVVAVIALCSIIVPI